MKKMNETKRRATVVCVLALLCGALLALMRMNVLFGSYDPSVGLYPKCSDTSAFEIGLIALSLSLMLGGMLFTSRTREYKIVTHPIAGAFAGGLAGFGFLALSASIFITDKIRGVSLTRFDSVLVILCLVCAASFWMEAFSREEKLNEDTANVLMLFRPICCLIISFYFYFDSSTVIHDSNKKMATLFFAVVLLSLLYEVKMRVTKARTSLFVVLNALSVCYGMMYSIPGLVWYFVNGESLMISVFFDVLGLFLTVWSALRLLSVTSCETEQSTEVSVENAENAENAEDASVGETETEAAAENADAPEAADAPEELSEVSENEV